MNDRDRVSNTCEARCWVVYELVDPLGDKVIHRDFDSQDYLDLIMIYPVIEVGQPGFTRVDQVYRAGRVPYINVLRVGLTEAEARYLVSGQLEIPVGLLEAAAG